MEVNQVSASKDGLPSSEPDCLTALALPQILPDPVIYYDEYKYMQDMQMLRNQMGLALPLVMCMERFAVSQTGRLPFLRSSNLMDDVLTGRCSEISFADYLKRPDYEQPLRSPHIVMEELLGIRL
ncbi:PREDICTED: proteasome maturation protein-like [Drosophila arizonae]|uniref:Proteasome maturation protein-like n=1 Tax=Drosophila arizonae TaxID=7263 RepID=A0ABM1NQD9_DROAR|nr:PREDICTED: proteasome maturation protein-like [Drosophila arizonae]